MSLRLQAQRRVVPIDPASAEQDTMAPIGLTIGIYGTIYPIVIESIGRSSMIIGVSEDSTLEQVAGLKRRYVT